MGEVWPYVQMLVVACYAPLCHSLATVLLRSLERGRATVVALAAHVITVFLCAQVVGLSYSLSLPTVAWMSLCWTVFAVPVLWPGVRVLGASRKAALAALSVALQSGVLAFWRVREILESLSWPVRPERRWLSFNWLATHVDALLAMPRSTYWGSVADPTMLDGLQRIPIAWLGVCAGRGARLAYVALLLAFLVASWVLWREVREGGEDRTVEVLALAVLASNLWGTLCSLLLLTSTGVVTLASTNPFQLVPIVCLLVMALVPASWDPMSVWEARSKVIASRRGIGARPWGKALDESLRPLVTKNARLGTSPESGATPRMSLHDEA